MPLQLLASDTRIRHSLLALLFTLAVSLSPASAQVVLTRDSADIRIIENRVPSSRVAIGFGGRPLMQIGNIDSTAETTFGDNLTAKLLPGGQIAVVDLQQREIRLFDGSTGAFIRSIGRAGKGPGEFGAAPTIAAGERGRIWAFDRSNRRLSLFDLNGRLLRERTFTPMQMRGVPNSYVPNAFQVSTAGNVLSAADDARGPGLQQQKVALLSSNDAAPIQIGSVVSTRMLLRHTGARTNSYYGVADPFRSHRSAAMAGGRIYVSHHDAWQIDIYDTRGDLQQIIRASIPRLRITPQLKARERMRHARMGPQFARLFDQLELADSASAIGEIKISADGTIWVARWRPPDRSDDQLFDLLNAKGEWLATVRVPAASGEVADVSAGKLLTIWRDPFDMPYLRVYSLPAGF